MALLGACLACALLVWAQPNASGSTFSLERLPVRTASPLADTTDSTDVHADSSDSSAVALTDTLQTDSLTAAPNSVDALDGLTTLSDSVEADTTEPAPHVERYVAPLYRRSRAPDLFGRPTPFLSPQTRTQPDISFDSTGTYAVQPTDGAYPSSYRVEMDLPTYRQEHLQSALRSNWQAITEERTRNQREQSGLGVNVVVPGGRQSAFSTIFGKPQVDLRVNGQADINAGFDYRKSDQQVSATGNAAQISPDFKQDLRLGITGTIGDKMQINVDWDTNNQFDYQNQVKLNYTGYEDEILQSVEAGNVFLETPSSLIRGGQSLFGLKSEFQIGNLHLTTVASQQEGQSRTLSIEGGSETTEFTLKPTDYNDNTHFFLSYYFRNRWNEAHSQPPDVLLSDGFGSITDIEVWKLRTTANPEETNVRKGVAMVDLGDPRAILTEADAFTSPVLPNDDGSSDNVDQYTSENLATLRDGESATQPVTYLTSPGNLEQPLTSSDYQVGDFKQLQRGRDYQLDENLGYISLNQRLQPNEALAVSFRYQANGRSFSVGDFASESGGTSGGQNADRLVFKLLRPANLTQPSEGNNPAAWYLQMRNIYRLRGRNFNANNFQLQVRYDPSGQTPTNTIPQLSSQSTLLQLLGLDRLNTDGAPRPDDTFDYINGFTIEPSDGLLIFPYLEPFGNRLSSIIDQEVSSPSQREQLKSEFVFSDLYTSKKENARRNTELDIYNIEGSYKSNTKDFYDLQAFAGVVEGSVEVTAGGTPLQEGTDYVVDYQGGTVTITNPTYLAQGRDIRINYEQNSFANLQKKTLLGARADYNLQNKFSLGATVMRLSEKSPVDKYRIGEEPIKNMIWGVDGSMNLEPRWLTRAVDALPLVQTRAESALSVSGEFAELRPGHTQTDAFERTRNDLQEAGRDFSSDELRGISYIDDFEGFQNTFSLKQQLNSWQLGAPPDSIARYPTDSPGTRDDSLRTNWRGLFGWYRLNRNIAERLSGKAEAFNPEAIELVDINDVFPGRNTTSEVDPTLTTLDLYFNPHRRGPYNYTRELQTFIQNPKDVWGGFTQRLPEGYTDFNLQNIEFVEFIFKPFPENAEGDAGQDAKLYVDLGSISEDVVPNQELNSEDGLSNTVSTGDFDEWGRLPGGQQNSAINIDGDRTEDLGLDGLVSYDNSAYPSELTEQERYASFLNALPSGGSERLQAAVARAQLDPSGDDYQYFNNDQFFGNRSIFPDGASFQERFAFWYSGHELNSFEAQNKLAQNVSVKRGNARNPDSEDLNFNSTVDSENNYFQYEVPLSKASLDSLSQPQRTDDYVVSEIERENGSGTGWYKVRIPVQDFTRRVGNIQDFSLIESMRMWTTGHEVPITLRMATLELVGSQWRASPEVAEDDTISAPPSEDTNLRVASINNEEDAGTYKPPTGAIVSQTRTARGAQQNAREQSLLLSVENLGAGRQQGVFKTYNQGINLLKYDNLRMYAHLHGTLGDGTRLSELDEQVGRSKARLFVRLGSNKTSDYYEYEQPLTPSRQTGGPTAEELWRPGENGMNLLLSALNELKIARDQSVAPPDSVFWNAENGELKPGVPDAESFAPQGTRLAIKGTPSLQNITTVIIGIRNPANPNDGLDPANVLEEVTLWVNELRVSGYDEENGWAAVANAEVKLADLGRIQGSFQRRTDGFGGLSSTLSEREQQSTLNWSMTADLNADQLLPERYGWSIPVSMQLQSNTTTPRFAPSRGDVRLSEVTNQIDARSDLSDPERDSLKSTVIRAAQTRSMTQSFTARIQKQGSDSWLLRNTLDGLSLNYSYARTDARNPSQQVNDSWRWSSTLSYQLNISQPHTVRPFWFLDDAPLIGGLGDLQFNYTPQSVSFSGSASRRFNQRRSRSMSLFASDNARPDRVLNPFREQQSFSHRRQFSLQYNPFNFLNLSFDTNTDQSLNQAGADTLLNVITRDGRIFTNVDTTTFFDEQNIPRDSIGSTAFFEERLRLRAEDQVLRDLFRGNRSPRTDNYEQRFTGTLRPSILSGETFNWVDLQNIVYRSTFRWKNGAIGRRTGANAENQVDIKSGITFHPQQFWRKFGFYRQLEEQQEEEDRSPQRRRPSDEKDGDEGDSNGDNQEGEDQDDGGPSLSDLPLPNPLGILRRLALTFTGIPDFSITYTAGRTSQSTNVGRVQEESGDIAVDYSLLDAVQGQGPSIGYRFGLDRRIGPGQRLLSTSRLATDALSDKNQLQARTTLTPSQSFRINLNWNVDWTSSESITYRPLEEGGFATFHTEQGTNAASIWAFGASYLDMFKSQLSTLRADFTSDASPVGDENGDGRVVLTNESVTEDFRSTYATGFGTTDRLGLLPFPMPNWNLNYSGLSSWPLVQRLTRNVTLRHSYSATYNAAYRSVTGDSLDSFRLGNRQVQFVRPDFQVGAMRVNERYQPFLGVDISWQGNLQTNLSWNRSNSYLLSTTNYEITENKTSELTFSASYRKRGLEIPLLPLGQLNNQISFNLTVSRAVNDEQRFSLRRALVAAASTEDYDPTQALQGDNVTPVTETTRLTVTPKISYQFSNRVSADFQLRYEKFNSADSRRPSFTNVSGGFFIQVNVSGG